METHAAASITAYVLASCSAFVFASYNHCLSRSRSWASWFRHRESSRRLCLPPVYEVFERIVDRHGFVSLDTMRYSVPKRLLGKAVTVYKYAAAIRIVQRGSQIAVYARLIGGRDARSLLPGHHPSRTPRAPALEQQLLSGQCALLDRYALALKQRAHGRGVRALRRLLELKRSYPEAAFHAALEQALHYGLFDLGRLETLILKYVAGEFFALDLSTDDTDA
jgi:hypothetical protein